MTLPRPIETFAIPEPRTERLYVRTPERLRGPFDVSVLKAMQVRGEIQPDTLLSPDRVRWVTAVSLSELFPVAMYVSSGPKTPQEMLWHVMIEGQRQGPIAWSSLVELSVTGKLRAMDLVTVDGGDNWVRASTIAGLAVPPDNGPSVLAQSKSSWLIGGGISIALLMLIPAVLMMVWNEKGIGLMEFISNREDGQSHENKQLQQQTSSDERIGGIRADADTTIAEITGEATVKAAELNAAAQGVKIARENQQHQDHMNAENNRTSAINQQTQRAAADAEMNRENNDRNTQRVIDKLNGY